MEKAPIVPKQTNDVWDSVRTIWEIIWVCLKMRYPSIQKVRWFLGYFAYGKKTSKASSKFGKSVGRTLLFQFMLISKSNDYKHSFPSYIQTKPIPAHKEGRDAYPYGIKLDPARMDLASTEGFANALWSVANLKPGSGHLTAPVCSTFVFMWLSMESCLGDPFNPSHLICFYVA